ncbi:hypothetical protein HF263_04085 [Rhizobium leguminosarum]|uniref:hypothetical protein n=1 Tax=Rhizobium leguminosarum TaxID=384 RepID=UPI001C916937|nr:hypothetical protein [Rhizobium leguminosarum]MBY2993801.1 hypothetical protein [Rhizobium leguminosarum]MBY3055251.1 hypothetical protein [Rhizobium leguminosarum]
MATLDELDQNESLVRMDVELEAGEQSWRRIYATPQFLQWLHNDLPNLETTIVGGDSEPDEQVDAVFHEFVIGECMDFDRRFKALSRTPDLFVWEFKTPDIRIFGWIPERDVFICCFGDHKDEIELYNRYGRYMAQTEYVRNNLDLDPPKAIESKDYEDVLSDAN